MQRTCLAVLLFSVLTAGISVRAQKVDLNVAMMQSTFMLQGQDSTGTAFLLLRPYPGQQPDAESLAGKVVLITAAHVFERMKGDEAKILWHVRDVNSDAWSSVPARLKIRANGKPLWTRNPNADVAVMYVLPPLGPDKRTPLMSIDRVVPTGVLADDAILRENEVGPGLELKCLGYPLGAASNAAQFPILRTGVIASYPLLPTSSTKTFLFDFRVFQGNSGGPVFYAESAAKGSTEICCKPQFIMGLVSEETLWAATVNEPYETRQTKLQLSLGVVVHASIIKETIELLPSPEAPEATSAVVPIDLISSQDQK